MKIRSTHRGSFGIVRQGMAQVAATGTLVAPDPPPAQRRRPGRTMRQRRPDNSAGHVERGGVNTGRIATATVKGNVSGCDPEAPVTPRVGIWSCGAQGFRWVA